jgi:hypothetical protein
LPRPYKFHIREQETDVLLGPACDDLERVEQRLTHYSEHLRLSDEDVVKMKQAATAVANALATVQGLRAGARGA